MSYICGRNDKCEMGCNYCKGKNGVKVQNGCTSCCLTKVLPLVVEQSLAGCIPLYWIFYLVRFVCALVYPLVFLPASQTPGEVSTPLLCCCSKLEMITALQKTYPKKSGKYLVALGWDIQWFTKSSRLRNQRGSLPSPLPPFWASKGSFIGSFKCITCGHSIMF